MLREEVRLKTSLYVQIYCIYLTLYTDIVHTKPISIINIIYLYSTYAETIMQKNEIDNVYKIGAVSRITGIGSETLRAWERRYAAVTPLRTNSGDRNYTRDHIAKLLLLKTLVDAGHSISSVANMSLEDLKESVESDPMLSKVQTKAPTEENLANKTTCRVALLGTGFPLRILDSFEEVDAIEIVGAFESMSELRSANHSIMQPDIVIVERPTINKNTKSELQEIRSITGAWHVILIYGFSNQELIQQNQSNQTTVVRTSIDVQELARLCIYHAGGSEQLPSLQKDSTLHFETNNSCETF